MKERTYWIDIAKTFAILGVMVDHTRNVLYTDVQIAYFSYFSVSLFVFLMGITQYWSLSRYRGDLNKCVASKCWKLFIPYLTATFVYSVFIDKAFLFENFIIRTVHFSASGPLYFVLLYIQLIVVSPVLFVLLKSVKGRWKHLFEMVILICVTGISYLTTNYTRIMDVYGGGGMLFGGTYLILFYCGMLLGKYHSTISERVRGKTVSWVAMILSICATVYWALFVSHNQLAIDASLPFGNGFNPPSISFMAYALLLASALFWIEQALQGINQASTKALMKIGFLGRHTLYIFMYHRLFLDYAAGPFMKLLGIQSAMSPLKSVIYFCLMIVCPILIETAHTGAQRSYKRLTAWISDEKDLSVDKSE